jgi:hypothetical protein
VTETGEENKNTGFPPSPPVIETGSVVPKTGPDIEPERRLTATCAPSLVKLMSSRLTNPTEFSVGVNDWPDP